MEITVRDYLKQYPDSGIDLLSPVGFVQIPPRTGRDLLAPGGDRMRFPVAGSKEKILASELLKQHICKIVHYHGDPWRVFVLADLPSVLSRRASPESFYEQTTFLTE